MPVIAMLKQTVREWIDDKAPRLGAALAFYTVFSLSPLLIIVVAIAGLVFSQPDQARAEIIGQLTGLVGEKGARAMATVMENAQQPKTGAWSAAIAVITLFIGATGVFVQLQDALNTIWGVKPRPKQGM